MVWFSFLHPQYALNLLNFYGSTQLKIGRRFHTHRNWVKSQFENGEGRAYRLLDLSRRPGQGVIQKILISEIENMKSQNLKSQKSFFFQKKNGGSFAELQTMIFDTFELKCWIPLQYILCNSVLIFNLGRYIAGSLKVRIISMNNQGPRHGLKMTGWQSLIVVWNKVIE